VYLEPKERLWWLQISFSPSPCTPHSHWGAISVSSNPVAGSDGPLRGEEINGKTEEMEKRKRKKKWKKGKERDRRVGENTPK